MRFYLGIYTCIVLYIYIFFITIAIEENVIQLTRLYLSILYFLTVYIFF